MISQRAAAFAVIVAFVAGLLASLALRPPGSATDPVQRSPSTADTVQLRARWRVPSAFPTATPIIGETPVWLAQRLREATRGALVLDVYDPGELVPAFSLVDAVRDGKVEAGYTWLGYDQGKIPASVLFAATPFGMEPWEYLGWWFEGGGRELADEIYAGYGIKPLLCGIIGPETAGWFRAPVEDLDDLRGLKIRMSGIGGKVLERAGASVTTLPAGEIFQALEKGAIDATEFSQPAIDEALGFDRVARHNYFPGWHQTFTASHVVIGQPYWDGLSAADQALVEMACDAVTTQTLATGEARQGPAMQRFAAKGVEAHYLDRDILEALREYTREQMQLEADRDADFARVYASQTAYRLVYRQWKEMGYLPRDF
ncbi:MAG: TRAP transporter substrate-binding protein [Halieaceae bacterium]|nr:TRAP transporter substrate-binding protein [Halieaceae bacterium]